MRLSYEYTAFLLHMKCQISLPCLIGLIYKSSFANEHLLYFKYFIFFNLFLTVAVQNILACSICLLLSFITTPLLNTDYHNSIMTLFS